MFIILNTSALHIALGYGSVGRVVASMHKTLGLMVYGLVAYAYNPSTW